LPLDYMLPVMRDPEADPKRRDAMAMAAAPYLHARLSTIDAKLSPVVAEPLPETTSVVVEFVVPRAHHTRDGQE
jgi:hypothetical protein